MIPVPLHVAVPPLRALPVLLSLAAALLGPLVLAALPAGAIELWSSTRDAFPVFDDPPPLSAAQAEADGVVFPRDAVIGVVLGGEARAYPIAVMGVHELGNDTVGGVPIAVTW